MSRLHGSLPSDEQQELMVSGRRSQAELAHTEALSVGESSITKPRRRAADRVMMAGRSTVKRPRLKAGGDFDGDLAHCQTVGYDNVEELMQDYYKTQPVCDVVFYFTTM